MASRLHKPAKAFGYAVLVWVVGFVWGSIVFMTPALSGVAPIPYVSRRPAISFPLLLVWPVLAYALARSYLKDAPDKADAALKLGAILAGVNLALDLLVLVMLLRAGLGYFASLTVWLAYALLFVTPLLARPRAEAATR